MYHLQVFPIVADVWHSFRHLHTGLWEVPPQMLRMGCDMPLDVLCGEPVGFWERRSTCVRVSIFEGTRFGVVLKGKQRSTAGLGGSLFGDEPICQRSCSHAVRSPPASLHFCLFVCFSQTSDPFPEHLALLLESFYPPNNTGCLVFFFAGGTPKTLGFLFWVANQPSGSEDIAPRSWRSLRQRSATRRGRGPSGPMGRLHVKKKHTICTICYTRSPS